MARADRPRLVVVGIDGVPLTLLEELTSRGVMPAMRALRSWRPPRELLSVLPTVSSAAWTSFMTGLHPPRHGIMGFVNKEPGSYDVVFPRREHIRGRLLQEIVSDSGGTVFSMGVPVTYPPPRLRGVAISCFLAPSLEKAVWPPEELATLRSLGYLMDADPLVAHEDRVRFMGLVREALERRIATVEHYFPRAWDLFLVHVMETDRLHHFYWRDYEDPSSSFHEEFFALYARLDRLFEWLANELDPERLVILSDHGFCRLEWEVNVTRWMVEQGMTTLEGTTPGPPLSHIRWSATRLYSMIPGRVWVNQRGREPQGIVPQEEARAVLEEFRHAALAWRDPHGAPVIERVLVREEIPGWVPDLAPDALLIPYPGMDLKDGALRPEVFEQKALSGMHTYDNALLFFGPSRLATPSRPWIGDMAPTLAHTLGYPVPEGMDGTSLT